MFYSGLRGGFLARSIPFLPVILYPLADTPLKKRRKVATDPVGVKKRKLAKEHNAKIKKTLAFYSGF